jgi:hypothetical protein
VATDPTSIEPANRRAAEKTQPTDIPDAPRVAQVRDEDLEPHAGLRYIARLFKVLALLLLFMLVAEIIIGFRQDGTAALGTLLIEATRLVVFAGFLWAAGDMALMLIEANHDLRATRILVGRLGARIERLLEQRTDDGRGEPNRSGPSRLTDRS